MDPGALIIYHPRIPADGTSKGLLGDLRQSQLLIKSADGRGQRNRGTQLIFRASQLVKLGIPLLSQMKLQRRGRLSHLDAFFTFSSVFFSWKMISRLALVCSGQTRITKSEVTCVSTNEDRASTDK
jgi:hypothetical protein